MMSMTNKTFYEVNVQDLKLLERVRKVVRVLVHGELVDDVVHDVWIMSMRRGVAADAAFVTFKHMVYDAMRVYKRREMVSIEGRPEVEEAVERVDGTDSLENTVTAALGAARLTALEKHTVVGKFWLGKTLWEIAQNAGVCREETAVALRGALVKIAGVLVMSKKDDE